MASTQAKKAARRRRRRRPRRPPADGRPPEDRPRRRAAKAAPAAKKAARPRRPRRRRLRRRRPRPRPRSRRPPSRQGGAQRPRRRGSTGSPRPASTPPSSSPSAALLLEERANLLGQAQRLEDEAAELMEDLDPGDVQFDDESGEGDTMVVERERDLALSAQARQTVDDIDAALQRDQGRHLRLLRGVRPPDPEGAPRGHPVGDRAGRGEGRRARLAAVTAAPRPVADVGQRRHRRGRGARSTSSPSHGPSTASSDGRTVDVIGSLRLQPGLQQRHGVQPGPGEPVRSSASSRSW